MNVEASIKQWLYNHEQEGIDLLQKLVQEPSKRGREAKAQAIIEEKCKQLNLEIDCWELEGDTLRQHPQFHCDRSDFSGNPNLAAVLKGSGGGKSILLNGHIDVVPEGNLHDWVEHPFSGIIKDGKMYGRGTTDMKGGTVSLLMAMDAIISLGIRLKGDVIFESVIEEESGGAGTLAAVLRGYRADGAIIPEPTNLKFFPLQQGSMWFRITVKGKSAHGGTRYAGVNAIEQAMVVMDAIRKLETKRNDALDHPLYETIPIPIPINLGKISGGDWPSSVPDTVILEGRFGVAPNESIEAAQLSLTECLSELNSEHEWFQIKPVEWEWFGARWLPGQLEENHPLTQVLTDKFITVFNKEPVIEASPWGTDGGYLSVVGKIPVMVFGPGITEMAHDANEHIELRKITEAAHVIALTILEWCGMEDA